MLSWLTSKNQTASEDVKSVAPLSALSAVHLGTSAAWTPRTYAALAREGYQNNAVVYRCVRMIAEACASVPLCADREGACDPADPVVGLLKSPHPSQTSTEIFEALYGYLQVSGNGYLDATVVDGKPIALQALRPDTVEALTTKQGRIAGYKVGHGAGARTVSQNALTGACGVFHMRLFHPRSDVYGLSPMEAAAHAIDIHNQGGVWTKSLLDNAARPSGALVYKGQSGADRLTDDQFKRLKTELQEAHTGPRHAGRPMVLEGGLDWTAMSLSPADMDFINARREAAREIALAFGIPPMMLGIPGDNTYANFKEAHLSFWRQTVLPLVTKTSRALELWLRPFFGDDLAIHPDISHVPALAHDRIALGAALKDLEFLTGDEKRSVLGFAPRDGHPSGGNQ